MRGQFGIYEVTGPRKYRGHDPGTTFEASLDPNVEQRAIQRRDIRLIRRVTPSLLPGSYRLPHDWPPPEKAAPTSTNEAPEGASLI